LVTSYDLQSGNGIGLCWKKYIDKSKSKSKQVRKYISKKESIRKEESNEESEEGS